jgi:hypothetical protein
MQITPDKATQLMKEGLTDRDIEKIWQFYNDVLKNRELSDILTEIEAY